MPGWAESTQVPSHGGFVVFGVCLSVCQCVGGFMGPSPSVLLSQVPNFRHALEMNWGHRREHPRFLTTSTTQSENMRLRRSQALVPVLSMVTCICAFHTIGAMDIPLDGECQFVFVTVTAIVHLNDRKKTFISIDYFYTLSAVFITTILHQRNSHFLKAMATFFSSDKQRRFYLELLPINALQPKWNSQLLQRGIFIL